MNFIKVTDNKKVFADGVHDDTKALQECIDKVKDGGTVYFPDGTYLISAALIFYSNQIFKLSDNAVILLSISLNRFKDNRHYIYLILYSIHICSYHYFYILLLKAQCMKKDL